MLIILMIFLHTGFVITTDQQVVALKAVVFENSTVAEHVVLHKRHQAVDQYQVDEGDACLSALL